MEMLLVCIRVILWQDIRKVYEFVWMMREADDGRFVNEEDASLGTASDPS